MANTALLDASALLAYLQGEPGADMVRDVLLTHECGLTSANLAEVIARSLDRGILPDDLQSILHDLPLNVLALDAEDGARAGWLRAQTRSKGLSLGDRLCLASAQRHSSLVLTADRPWLTLGSELGLDIRCIRPDQH